MSTTSSKTTRKATTSRAATSTSRSAAAPADETPADDTTTAAEATGSEQPAPTAGGDPASPAPASDDPAAALKQKIRTTQHVTDAKPDDLTDEQRVNLVGAPAGALPGPRTLPSPSSPTRTGEEYVHAETEGHIAFVPKRQQQSSTVRVWVVGQHVRKDVYDALSGFVAATPGEARVLSAEEYAQVAPHL